MLIGWLTAATASPVFQDVDCATPVEVSDRFDSQAIDARRLRRLQERRCRGGMPWIYVPPLVVGVGVATRDRPTWSVDLGVEAVRRGPLRMELGLATTQPIEMHDDTGARWQVLERQVDLAVGATYGVFALDTVVGVRVQRHWEQAIRTTVPRPFGGVGVEVGRGNLGFRARYTFDLPGRPYTHLDGTSAQVPAGRWRLGLFGRFGLVATPEVGERTRWPPLSRGMALGLRARLGRDQRMGPSMQLGVTVLEGKRWSLEGGVTGWIGQPFALRGLEGGSDGVAVVADLWWEPGPLLAVGVGGGLQGRNDRIEGAEDVLHVNPLVEVRTFAPLLRVEGWSVGLETRSAVTLGRVRLHGPASVEDLDPFGFEMGLRVVNHLPGARQGGQPSAVREEEGR